MFIQCKEAKRKKEHPKKVSFLGYWHFNGEIKLSGNRKIKFRKAVKEARTGSG